MNNEEKSRLKAWVLRKLARNGYWGHRPTDLDNIPKGAPKHLWKEIRKNIVSSLNDVDFLIKKTGMKGIRYSLNPHKKKEILDFIKKYYPNAFEF